MGIPHLYSFLSKTVPNGIVQINIREEVNTFKRNNPRKTPVIIVDLLALHNRVFEDDREILMGGRYNIYNERATQIFTALQSLNARIIFVCDGPTPPNKMKTCLRRRNNNYCEYVKILRAIDNGSDLNKGFKDFRVQNLTQFVQNFIHIAKNAGELHISVLNECDQEIVKLANTSQALAIISHDTDFLIFEGNWKVWSANDIDFQTMNTSEFNKWALRDKLSLSSRQMVMLGALSGNDILTYEMVQDYHRRIAPSGGKFYKIANEVRSLHSLPPKLNPSDENYIINTVFKPQDRSQGLIDLQNSLYFYCLVNMNDAFANYTLETVSKDSSRFTYVILCGNEYILNLVYFDLSTDHFMPYYSLIQQILRRIMGILLKSEQHRNPTRKFYSKLKHERPYEPIIETPEYPPYRIPPVLKLLFSPYGKDEHLDTLRLNLFCWQISPKLNNDMILELPKENLITVISIFYLFEQSQISVQEADCILFASNCPPETSNYLNFDEITNIDGRDARLAFLFPRIFNWIYNCLAAVGLNDFYSLITFDGLYFHHLRKQCRENNMDNINSLIDKYECLRLYAR